MDSIGEAECYAAGIWRTLRVAESPGARALSERVFGTGAIVWSGNRAAGIVEPHGGKLRVVVPRLSDPPTSHWQIGHALADWFLARDGVPLSERWTMRATLAATIILPADQVVTFAPKIGAVEIARVLTLPVAASLLREAEVSRVPTVLLTAKYIRARGDDVGRLPRERAALELLASSRGIGVEKYTVPEGVVLRIA